MADNGIRPHEAAILEWLGGQKQAMLELLETVVNIDSGSYDKAGANAVGRRFIDFFAEHGLVTAVEPNERFGDAIHIRLDDTRSNEKPVLLMGHRDTVFPKGEVARRPFRIEAGRAYGPGVSDMKGGSLSTLFWRPSSASRPPSPLTGLSPATMRSLASSLRSSTRRARARCLFNSEPGRPGGAVVRDARAACSWGSSQGQGGHSGVISISIIASASSPPGRGDACLTDFSAASPSFAPSGLHRQPRAAAEAISTCATRPRIGNSWLACRHMIAPGPWHHRHAEIRGVPAADD